jgi:hypothetical protein
MGGNPDSYSAQPSSSAAPRAYAHAAAFVDSRGVNGVVRMRFRLVTALSLHGAIRLDESIAEAHDSAGMARDIFFVCHDDQRVPLRVELLEQIHDFDACFRIEISGRFIRQDD